MTWIDEQMVMQIDLNAYMSKIHGMYDFEKKGKGFANVGDDVG
jgi:hypothetical protein